MSAVASRGDQTVITRCVNGSHGDALLRALISWKISFAALNPGSVGSQREGSMTGSTLSCVIQLPRSSYSFLSPLDRLILVANGEVSRRNPTLRVYPRHPSGSVQPPASTCVELSDFHNPARALRTASKIDPKLRVSESRTTAIVDLLVTFIYPQT
jgi:hypothetical protein